MLLFSCLPFDHVTIPLTGCFWHQSNPLGVPQCTNCALSDNRIERHAAFVLNPALHRIAEWMRLERNSAGYLVHPCPLSSLSPLVVQVQSAKAGCPGP